MRHRDRGRRTFGYPHGGGESEDAIELIHSTSRGLPRSVNDTAWQSLIAAYAGQKSIVDESFTRAVVTDYRRDTMNTYPTP
jgi:hypothetical protein